MSRFIDFAEKRLAGLGIETKLSEDRNVLVLRQETEEASLLVILQEEGNLLLASFSPGVRVPEAKLPAMREFVCAVNGRLRFGTLELARDNAELSFKIANLLYSPDFTEDLLRKIMATGVQTTITLLKGAAAVLDGVSCEEALQRLA